MRYRLRQQWRQWRQWRQNETELQGGNRSLAEDRGIMQELSHCKCTAEPQQDGALAWPIIALAASPTLAAIQSHTPRLNLL